MSRFGLDRRLLRDAVVIWLASRAGLLLVAYLHFAFPSGVPTVSGHVPGGFTVDDLFGSWVRWDAVWYLDIASRGYFTPRSAAFFPLFSALTGAFATGLRMGVTAAGFLVANLAWLVALYAAGRLAALVSGQPDLPLRSMLLMAASPFAFFTAIPYSDGLFMAIATLGLGFALTGRWRATAAAAFLAVLCRPTGVALAAALLVGLLGSGRALKVAGGQSLAPGRPPAWAAILLLAALAAGLGLVAAIDAIELGDPLLFVKAQAIFWHRHPVAPWTLVGLVAGNLWNQPVLSYEWAMAAIDLGSVLLTAGVLLRAWSRLPRLLGVYGLLVVALAVATPITYKVDVLVSAGRLLLAATPVFPAAALLLRGRPRTEIALIATFIVLQSTLVGFFLGGGWVE